MLSHEEMYKIKDLIDSLTEDEDLRQDLWLLFLSGIDPLSLNHHLNMLHWEHLITDHLSIFAYNVMASNYRGVESLRFLSPIEKHVVILVAAGVSLDVISEYNGISIIRLRQMLISIQKSSAWIAISKG